MWLCSSEMKTMSNSWLITITPLTVGCIDSSPVNFFSHTKDGNENVVLLIFFFFIFYCKKGQKLIVKLNFIKHIFFRGSLSSRSPLL